MITMRNRVILSIVTCGMLFSSNLYAENDENIIDSIMKLRGDVESLYSKIDENKEQYKSQIKSLAMQRADNEAQINRKETAIELAKTDLNALETKIKMLSNRSEDIKPMLFLALDDLESIINSGIPFKIEERLAEVTKLRTQLKDSVITQEKALALIWASYDDTIRLTKEIGLFKQSIEVDGETKMAQIAKIGSMMLFFATPDEQMGYVVKENGKYRYKVITDDIEKTKIVALFDALQKQIRTGYFTLPNALVLMEKK